MGKVKQGGPGTLFTLGHALRKTEWYDRRYSAYIQSDAWRSLTKAVRERDGNACRACGVEPSPEDRLSVHHRSYWSPFRKDDPSKLVLLCRKHHDECHLGTPKTGTGLELQTRRVLRYSMSDDPAADSLMKFFGNRQGPDRITLAVIFVGSFVTAFTALFVTGAAQKALHALPCPPIIGGPTCQPHSVTASVARLPVTTSTRPPSPGSPSAAPSSPSSSVPPSRSSSASLVPPSSSLPLSPSESSAPSPPVTPSSFDVSDPSTWTAEEAALWAWCMTGGQDMAQTNHAHRSRSECVRDLREFHSRSTRAA